MHNTLPLEDVSLSHIALDNKRYQPRISMTYFDIRRSLQRVGQLDPIELLGPKPFTILDGFRRCYAARDLGWTTIKCRIHAGLTDAEALQLAFTRNNGRKNFSSMDKANAMRMAEKLGQSRSAIADMFGLSQKQVGRYLALAALPAHIQSLIDDDWITMAHAHLLYIHGVGNLAETVSLIKQERLTVPQLRHVLRKTLGKLGPSRAARARIYIRQEAGHLRFYAGCLSLKSPHRELERALATCIEAAGLLQRAIDGRP